MSYVLASTTPDELLLMIAAEDGERRPVAHDERDPDYDVETWGIYGTRQGMPPRQAPGFCFLNKTDNLRSLYPRYFYDNPRNYAVINLTWAGWDRVEELLAAGATLPTEEERSAYAQRARLVVEGGDHGDFIPYDVPNPEGIEPGAPEPSKRRWWHRLRPARIAPDGRSS